MNEMYEIVIAAGKVTEFVVASGALHLEKVNETSWRMVVTFPDGSIGNATLRSDSPIAVSIEFDA